MEGVRLVELQHHGEEVQELKRNKAELVALHVQLEQKVAQKEAEVTRLRKRCQDLVKLEEKRLERQSKVAKNFLKYSPHRQNAVDQKVMDVIDNYESRLSEMQQELDHLRKETESHNSSFVGSYGDIETEPAAGSEDVSQSADSSSNVSSDAAPSDPLKGAGGKWLKDEKVVTLNENKYRAMEEKLLCTEKQLKDSKKLIKLLESENTHLKLELESRPNHDEWKKAQKYNKQLERLLAQNNLSLPSKKHRKTRPRVSDNTASRTQTHATHGKDDMPFLKPLLRRNPDLVATVYSLVNMCGYKMNSASCQLLFSKQQRNVNNFDTC
ncbi:hypothetical protein ACROYT_G025508 [Oculina patagonica]